MVNAVCPSCGSKVSLYTRPKVGQRVVCPTCKTELEVTWLEPVELDWPFDVEEYEGDEFETEEGDDS